jgi:hypothetical protein
MVKRKTVTIHPLVDTYVRKLWSKLVEEGFRNPRYSTALNIIALYGVLSMSREVDDELWKQALDLLRKKEAAGLDVEVVAE